MGSLGPWTSRVVLCDKCWEVGDLAQTAMPTGCVYVGLSEFPFSHPYNELITLVVRIKWDTIWERNLKLENL